jgi:hypothetical protein
MVVQHYQLRKKNKLEVVAELIELEREGSVISYYLGSKVLMIHQSLKHFGSTAISDDLEMIFTTKWI